MVIARPTLGGGGSTDGGSSGGYASPGEVGATDPGGTDDDSASQDTGSRGDVADEDTAGFDDVGSSGDDGSSGGYASPGDVGATDPPSVPDEDTGADEDDAGRDAGDPSDAPSASPPDTGDDESPDGGESPDASGERAVTRGQLREAATAATSGAGELARRTASAAGQMAPGGDDLRAAAASAASGAGEMARGVSATDFGAFSDRADAIAEDVEQKYPTLDRGEDYEVTIDERTGEYGVDVTEAGTEEVARTGDQLQTAAAAATSGSGELARGTPDVQPPEPEPSTQPQTLTGFRPREGGTAERREAVTGRDVDGDGDVTTPVEYIRGRAEESFEAQTGAELSPGDIEVSRDRGGNVNAYLSESGEAAVERELSSTGFTAKVPSAVPLIGGMSQTVKGPSAGVDVESRPGGTDVERVERGTFGEFLGPAWSAYEGGVEYATGGFEDVTDRAAGIAGPAVGLSVGLLTSGDGDTAEKLTRGAVAGIGDLVVGGGELVTEGPELAYSLATSAEARRRAPEAAAGMLASSATAAAERPYFFLGQVAGSAALTGGAVTALQGTRFAGAARFAASPVGTTLRRFDVPDVRGAVRSRVESGVETARGMVDSYPEFRMDDTTRGRMDATDLFGTPPKAYARRSGAFDTGEAETDSGAPTITAEDIAERRVEPSQRYARPPGSFESEPGGGPSGFAGGRGEAQPDVEAGRGGVTYEGDYDPPTPTVDVDGGPSRTPGLRGRLGSIREAARRRRVLAGLPERRRSREAVRAGALGATLAAADAGFDSQQFREQAQRLEARAESEAATRIGDLLGFGTDVGYEPLTEYEGGTDTETRRETETGIETGAGTEYEPGTETETGTETRVRTPGFQFEGETTQRGRRDRRNRRRREDERMGFSFGEADAERDSAAGLGYLGETFAGLAGVDYESAAARTTEQRARETGLPAFTSEQERAFEATVESLVPGWSE